MPPSFDLHEVEQAIAATEFAGHLTHLPTVHSTNDLALTAARAGARHGVWIADEQTAGRGRGSHTWHSPPGSGLYLTTLIAPPIPIENSLRLSLTTAIAVQCAIASITGFHIPDQLDIRWPNDLLLNGRKCGGILIETAAQPAPASGPAMLRYAVVGIGINCNHTTFPPDLDPIATSLRREMPRHELPSPPQPLRREPLTAAILIALDREIRLLPSNPEPRTSNLSQFSTWITGKRVRVEPRDPHPQDPAPSYTGITAGLDPNGFLLVRGDDGQLHTVLSGGLREP